jgi:hypothetical protein
METARWLVPNFLTERLRLPGRNASIVIFSFIMLVDIAQACSCIPITAAEASRRADVVFRGTIVDIHDVCIEPPQLWKRVAIFRVSRVWKGVVGDSFEMPAIENPGGLCYGFAKGLLAIGNELIVYANRSSATGQYSTGLCSHTALASRTHDILELGPGKMPAKRVE